MIRLNNKYKIKGDKGIWAVYFLLLVLSLIFVYTSIGRMAGERINRMFFKQFFMLLTGFGACYVSHLVNYQIYSRITQILKWGAYIILVFTLVYGKIVGGDQAANRWVSIGFFGFQPSEIAKYILVLVTADTLARSRENIKSKETFWKAMIPIIIVSGLIFLENFSTAILVAVVCCLMLLVGRINFKYLFRFIGVAIIILSVATVVLSKTEMGRGGTAISRITAFVNHDPNDITQTNIALMAISTGGISGTFIGGTEVARFLNESHNDFIFAIILEEGGLFACVLVLFLYAMLVYRILCVAQNTRGYYGKFVATGIALMITLQATMNMMVATNLMPVTGQTLPFISFGGTSMIITSFALGMVLNISKTENQREKKTKLFVAANQQIEDDYNEEVDINSDSKENELEKQEEEVTEYESNN